MPAIATGYVASEIARHGYQNLYDLLQRASREFPERHAFSCGDSISPSPNWTARPTPSPAICATTQACNPATAWR